MAGVETELEGKFVIIGGGICGVTCAETLAGECPDEKIILITSSPLVKSVVNYQQVSRTMETFDVEEKPSSVLESLCPNVAVVHASVTALHAETKVVVLSEGKSVRYDKLCICTGGKPKLIPGNNPHVIGIRDTESVKDFQKRLSSATRIVVVGNGGIATELVYEVEGCQVVWAIKHNSISSTFVDAGAAQFFLPQLAQDKVTDTGPCKRLKYTLDKEGGKDEDSEALRADSGVCGSALGPDWAASQTLKGASSVGPQVYVEYQVEVVRVLSPEELTNTTLVPQTPSSFTATDRQEWPAYVELTNGCVYGCDLVVSATGVTPFTELFLHGNQFDVSEDGGFRVNDRLQTSVPDVYAAGDVCTASWESAKLWHQMRLWTQARQMGNYAGRSMVAAVNGQEISLDICFELFAHVTNFFGYKVVLLGLFNAQGLGNDYEVLLRVTQGEEYIKVVLHNDRLVGAVLIGDTEMEETFENLALNETDLADLKEHLLEPGIDIDDFFD